MPEEREKEREDDYEDEDVVRMSVRKLKSHKMKKPQRKVSIQVSKAGVKALNPLVRNKSLSVESDSSCKSIKTSQIKIKESRFVTIK